jgi:hypothetical protein
MQNDSVGFAELRSGAVGTSTLQDGSVSRSKIGSGQVGTTQITDDAITNAKIGPNAVGLGEIADGAQVGLVNNKVLNGEGLSKDRTGSGVVLRINFGTASNQVPRGNHIHGYTTPLASTLSHRHVGTTGAPFSSRAVKKDITNYHPENIKNLLRLEPKKYKYKNSKKAYQEITNREWMHGYLIEDLISLGFTEPILYDKNGNPERLDYSLVSLLVLELVKLQQTEIEYLKKEIKNLKDAK